MNKKHKAELMLAKAVDNRNQEEVLYWSKVLCVISVQELVVKMKEFSKSPACKLLFPNTIYDNF